jgi:hypothetical protein
MESIASTHPRGRSKQHVQSGVLQVPNHNPLVDNDFEIPLRDSLQWIHVNWTWFNFKPVIRRVDNYDIIYNTSSPEFHGPGTFKLLVFIPRLDCCLVFASFLIDMGMLSFYTVVEGSPYVGPGSFSSF